jgi:YbbR domain-containing protein
MNLLKYLFKDWPLKLISLIIAMILWFHSATEKIYIAERDTIIEYQNISTDITFRELPPGKIKAMYEASGKDLLRLYFFKPKIVLNLKEIKPGKISYALDEKEIKIPEGIEVYRIVLPENFLELSLEEKESKEVPVKLGFVGEPKQGYSVASLNPAREKITITGPKSLIEKINEVKGNEIEVSGKKNSFYEYIKILSPSKLINVKPGSLRVYVQIERELIKEIEKEPTIISPEGYKVDVKPDRVKIKIKGTIDKVEEVKSDDVTVMLNLIGFGHGEYYLPPKVFTPDSVEVEEVEPSFIRVKLEKEVK